MSSGGGMKPVNLSAHRGPDVDLLLTEIQRTQDLVTDSRGEQLHIDDLQRAVALGIKAAVSDPDMWEAAVKAMRTKAQSEAGSWLFGGVRSVLAKVGWLLVAVLGIYLVGGWAGVVAFFKTGAHQ